MTPMERCLVLATLAQILILVAPKDNTPFGNLGFILAWLLLMGMAVTTNWRKAGA